MKEDNSNAQNHTVWHPEKIYQTWQEAGKCDNRRKIKSITEMTDDRISRQNFQNSYYKYAQCAEGFKGKHEYNIEK